MAQIILVRNKVTKVKKMGLIRSFIYTQALILLYDINDYYSSNTLIKYRFEEDVFAVFMWHISICKLTIKPLKSLINIATAQKNFELLGKM